MLVSAHAAGVTVSSLALALSGPRRTLLAECRPLGGSIRTGFRQGLEWGGEVGLAHLADADRAGDLAGAFETHLRPLDAQGHRLILPGLTDPLQAPALARTWEPLLTLFQAMDREAGYDVVIDGGPVLLEPGGVHAAFCPVPLLQGADVVVLVARNTRTSIAQSLAVARGLREELSARGSGVLRLLLIEEGRLASGEIAQRLRIPVLGALPWDPVAGALFTHGSDRPPKLAKLPLMEAAQHLWEALGVLERDRTMGLSAPPVPVRAPGAAGVLKRLSEKVGVSGRG
ncbi:MULTISPECIES: MinD/ParA family ATP-binding protein [Streptomyces]|uniref:MinD/ParA family ATP-binding protein n=1 Tax=Streptomyces TaxID=1883 RepID=UPI001F3E0920|nr:MULTISPECIES: hypothetical protein [Streptomyces]